jgi:putative flippase GtrA
MLIGEKRRFFRFLLTGLANTGVSLVTIALALGALNASQLGANALGLAAGLLTGFTLNKKWVFSHDGELLPTASRYIAAFALSYTLNAAVLKLSLDVLNLNSLIAQTIALVTYSTIFFISCHWFVFPSCTSQHEAVRTAEE